MRAPLAAALLSLLPAGPALAAAPATTATAPAPVATPHGAVSHASTPPRPAAGRTASAVGAAHVPVRTFQLPNGMRFLLVPRPEMSTVVAGWVAHVGSSNEHPGITGLAHLFEHMLFKGTRTIGTKDIQKDLAIIAEQEQLQEQIRQQYRLQRARWRQGEIADPFGTEGRTPELVELEKKFQQLVEEQRQVMVKNEYDSIYQGAGASGKNAATTQDLTLFFVTVPANKVELWFWMESDRLYQPVFREFYSERDVVHEERRLRIESTPTGRFDEEFDALFWEAHPYHWPVVGWPSDLRVISKDEADRFFKLYYAPNNVTGVLVGNFDPVQVEALARRYFGRLEASPPPPDVATLEPEQLAEKRMLAECDCPPQVTVRYHTVPFEHRDGYALDVLAGVLNGNTGRLYKSMVLARPIASAVAASQDSRKWAGAFEVTLQAKGEHTPEELEAAWYEQLARLQNEPVSAEELQKVKNQIAADAFRRLQNPFFLMLQLAWYDGLGDWQYLNEWAPRTLAVNAADVQRVARQYFAPANRAVALYRRKPGAPAAAVPPEIAALPAEVRPMVQQQVEQIDKLSDPEQLTRLVTQLEAQKANVPDEMKAAFKVILAAARARLEQVAPGTVPVEPQAPATSTPSPPPPPPGEEEQP
jgi:predicted Zn-dependent peptidase